MREGCAKKTGNIYFLVKPLGIRLINHRTAKDSSHFYQRKWDTLVPAVLFGLVYCDVNSLSHKLWLLCTELLLQHPPALAPPGWTENPLRP